MASSVALGPPGKDFNESLGSSWGSLGGQVGVQKGEISVLCCGFSKVTSWDRFGIDF